jgi:hypothetical protein
MRIEPSINSNGSRSFRALEKVGRAGLSEAAVLRTAFQTLEKWKPQKGAEVPRGGMWGGHPACPFSRRFPNHGKYVTATSRRQKAMAGKKERSERKVSNVWKIIPDKI